MCSASAIRSVIGSLLLPGYLPAGCCIAPSYSAIIRIKKPQTRHQNYVPMHCRREAVLGIDDLLHAQDVTP